MKTSEVLYKAADLIEERGWTEGSGWEHEKGGPLCLEGGILAAIGGSHLRGDHYSCPAYKAVRDYLSHRTDKAPFLWNDNLASEHVSAAIKGFDFGSGTFDMDAARAEAAEYAQSQVIATLRAAALIEAAKESAPAVMELTADYQDGAA